MFRVFTAKWALFRPYLSGQRRGLGQGNKGSQFKCQLKVKSVGEKNYSVAPKGGRVPKNGEKSL